MDPTALWRQIAGTPFRASFWRYVGTLGIAAAATFLIHHIRIQQPFGGILNLGVYLLCSWFGGLKPALLLAVLLYILSRLLRPNHPNGWALTTPEFLIFSVIASSCAAFGMAGQYRRRIRAVTEQSAQKLRDQARAVSLAHIIFRDIQGQITEWNEGAEELYGWTSEDAVGRDLHELLQTEFPVKLAEIQQELLRTGQWQGEMVHRHQDGTELIIATHWIFYQDKHGTPIGIAEVHNDVSELRRAEAAVREADRRKDEFLAMLAHELRNPLAPIRTGLELMKLAHDPETIETTREIMERQTHQLVTLVDDLLDVSRITRGKLELRRCQVNLSEIVQSAVETSRPFIEEAEHELTVNLPDSPILLNADPHRLAQVFSNLLNNAAKYTPSGGMIHISAEREGRDAIVTVQDNGIGIPAEMREVVFEMFSQIDRPQERGYSGLGIGLTLVKSLVEKHDGSVEVHSHGSDGGSTFRVRLPVLTIVPMNNDDREFEQANFEGRHRVLVVDDNVAAAKTLSCVLKLLGHTVRTANDGQQAIEVASDFRPDVIFMDLGMPRKNGYEAAQYIRQMPWGESMLLVALTGWGQAEDRQRTKEAGFDHHLVKPAEPSDLQQILSQLAPKTA